MRRQVLVSIVTIAGLAAAVSGCRGGGASLLRDEPVAPAPEVDIPYMEKLLREPLAARLAKDDAGFPLYSVNNVEWKPVSFLPAVSIQVKSTGITRFSDPVTNLSLKVTSMVAKDASYSNWEYVIKIDAPIHGHVHNEAGSPGPSVGSDYRGRIEINVTGILTINEIEGVGDKIALSTRFTKETGHIYDVDFDQFVYSALEGRIVQSVNEWIAANETELLKQSNGSLSEAENNGQMITTMDNLFAVLPGGGN